jgi:hypothetical protein
MQKDTPLPDVDEMVIHTSGEGIGDAVSQLYAVCGLIDATKTNVRMLSKHPDWFKHISHPGLEIVPFAGVYHRGIDCNRNYEDQLEAAAYDHVPTRSQWLCNQIAFRLGIAQFQPAMPKFVTRPAGVIAERNYYVLAPFSLHTAREWPKDRWRELIHHLRSIGKQVVVIDRPGDGVQVRELVRDTGALCWWGQHPHWTTALIANAEGFFGNDSGMTHIAALHGVPTVAVMSHLSAEFVFAPAVVHESWPEKWSCVGCAWRRACPTSSTGRCGALDSITSENTMIALGSPPFKKVDVNWYVQEKLEKRAVTTWSLFNLIRQRWKQPQIVETGCVRSKHDWSAGYMTWLLGALVDEIGGGKLVSVDIDPFHVATARRLCRRWNRVSVVESCSGKYLENRSSPVDVAYIDSVDTDVAGHAEHCLRECRAVAKLMAPNGLIVIDDSPIHPNTGERTGKGQLAIPWLVSNGWRIRNESGYQVMLEREEYSE